MTISTSFQAYSLTTMRLSIGTSSAPTTKTPATAGSTPATQDRVSLSPGATGAAPPVDAVEDDAVVPVRPPAASGNPKSAALLAALDADEDGLLSEREFTEGARALLDRDKPGRVRQDDDEGRRGGRRLERRLEKAFDRIDNNGDGSLDASELTAALGSRRRDGDDRNAVTPPAPSAPPTSGPSGGFSLSFVSVTYVSVAVQRYTSLQPPAGQAPPQTSSGEDATTTGGVPASPAAGVAA